MNNYKLSKINLINVTIIILGIIFLWLYGITYTRLKFFLVVLLIILIYRIIINKLENSSFSIQNKKLFKYILILNNCRNPLLYFIIKIDIIFYDGIIKYNNKILNFVIYCCYILIINPIKIFHFKFYKILGIGKESKLKNIVLNRMLGLILSVLIFTNIIMYLKNIYNLNIIMIIYLYLLVISILCEIIQTRESKWLKIFLVNNIDSKSILMNRFEVNLLSIILKKSNIDELIYYKEGITKLDKCQIGLMWYSIQSLKLLLGKPSYSFYIKLRSCLDLYCKSIDSYIFFEYHEGNVPNIELIKDFNINDINKLKKLYEYDYQVFKTLLFLYGDLEYYIGNLDYVKDSLIVDSDDVAFLSIKLNNSTKSELQFLDKIKYKEPNYFFEKNDIINQLVQLDLCNYRYLKLSDICTLKEICDPINPLYYESYIKKGYKEWYSEINQDLTSKYKMKILELDCKFNQLNNKVINIKDKVIININI